MALWVKVNMAAEISEDREAEKTYCALKLPYPGRGPRSADGHCVLSRGY